MPIIRHGYASQPNHNTPQRRRNRQHILTTATICHLCGQPLNGQPTDIDHIIPISLGGTHDLHNLRPTHRRCNRSRGQG